MCSLVLLPTLVRLNPGHDTLEVAERIFGGQFFQGAPIRGVQAQNHELRADQEDRHESMEIQAEAIAGRRTKQAERAALELQEAERRLAQIEEDTTRTAGRGKSRG